MPAISQLGHVALVTPDIERSLWFFRDLLGMEEVERTGDRSYLRAYQELEHHSLVLREADYTGVDHIAMRTSAPEDVGLYADALRAAGVEVEHVAAGDEPGQGEAIRFFWPHAGHPLELYYDVSRPQAPEAIRSKLPSASSTRRGLGVRRLDHINVAGQAEALDPAVQWLTEHLGFHLREFFQPEGAPIMSAWMSVTPQVHDVAIMPDFVANRPGRLHHLAYNLENFHDVLTAADVLTDLDIQIDAAPGKHGIGQAMYLYVKDPGSGHRVELYAGGYLIFAPDFEPIRWTEETFAHPGLGWYGELEVNPSHPMYTCSPCFSTDDDAKAHPAPAVAAS